MQKFPHIEADKAGLIVYIKLSNQFKRYIPIYNIVAILNHVLVVRYGRVRQLATWQLTNFIFCMESCLSKSQDQTITMRIFKFKF